MPTNVIFENFSTLSEQDLLEDLVSESIEIYGQDMYYIPRKLNNFDKLYGEDDQSSFENSYMVAIYIKSVDGFGGDGSFFSKMDFEIRDRVTFTISRREFENEVLVNETTMQRPNEGDLIYFPLNKKCFQIKYVEKYAMFYPLGTLPTYDLQCELFEYSGETMATGIPEIDSLQSEFSRNALDYAIRSEDGFFLTTEEGEYIITEAYLPDILEDTEDNDFIQSKTDDILDFTESDPFSEDGTY